MEKKISQGIKLISILSMLIGLLEVYRSIRSCLYAHSMNNAIHSLWMTGSIHDAIFLFLGGFLLWRLNNWGRYLLMFIFPVVTLRMIMLYLHLKTLQNMLAMQGRFSDEQHSLMVPNAPEHPIGIYVPSDTQIQITGIMCIVLFVLSAIVIIYLIRPAVKEQFK